MEPYYAGERVTLYAGDCLDVLRELDDASVDAVVCDPPYNLSFMSKAWDRIDGEPIDPAFMHWLAGFIDGEGCFSVHKKPQNTYDCQFSISLRADDRPILERIQRTLGMGTLSKPTAHRTGPDNPKARWSVSKKSELVRLRDLLRAFPLRAKKATDFEVWSDALDSWVDHITGDWDEMAELRKLLMDGRAYKDDGVRVDPFQMWCWRWGRECFRILKPGGHLLSFGGTRTFHRLAAGLEDAGFEIRDSIAWLYGSGFAKSWNFKTQFNGVWCECNALPYNHADNSDLPRVREDIHSPALASGEGQDAPLLASVQRGRERSGVGDARTQRSRGLVPGGGSIGSGENDGSTEPGVGRGQLHRRQGVPADQDAGSPERTAEWLRPRARPSDGSDDRAASGLAGGGAPHQRTEGGQQAGESSALPEPHGPLDDGALRDGAACPRCGGLDPLYRGFGSALKPAHEPVVVARKPLTGTVAANVLAHGTGALNIDGCRIGDGGQLKWSTPRGVGGHGVYGDFVDAGPSEPTANAAGRWPANVILDESQAAALDAMSGESVTPSKVTRGASLAGKDGATARSGGAMERREGVPCHGDSGGASRFFYTAQGDDKPCSTHGVARCTICLPTVPIDELPGRFTYTAKAPGSERVKLPAPERTDHDMLGGKSGTRKRCSKCGLQQVNSRPSSQCSCPEPDWQADPKMSGHIAHPTVKPLDLMRWLVRLVTPPGGIVLEPFAGSGTTVEACLLEGFRCVAIEREPDYLPLIMQRINRRIDPVAAVRAAADDGGLFDLLGEETA